MAKNDVVVTDNPKLKHKVLSDGNYSLYLDYYLGRVYDKESNKSKVNRKREFLKLTLYATPRTPEERKKNKEVLALAKQIREEREQEMKEEKLGYRLQGKEMNFLEFLKTYVAETPKDKRMLKGAMNRFLDFIAEEYPSCSVCVVPNQVTREMMIRFVDYLKGRGSADGAYTYWKRFKKMVKVATEKGVFAKNPCDGVVMKVDDDALKKDVLTAEEMERLIGTTYPQQNEEVRKAFIFSLYTGVRYCDVKDLTYANVDISKKMLSYNQAKTQGHSSRSWVYIPLSDEILSMIDAGTSHLSSENLFYLPSFTMCLKSLRSWTKKAGIDKHITWHCARHSFACLLLNGNANIKTVSSLLGHTSLTMTEKYVRAVDKLKEEAINTLPKLNIDC